MSDWSSPTSPSERFRHTSSNKRPIDALSPNPNENPVKSPTLSRSSTNQIDIVVDSLSSAASATSSPTIDEMSQSPANNLASWLQQNHVANSHVDDGDVSGTLLS